MPQALIAPDSFKGTMSAAIVADAVALGFEASGWRADRCPLGDGGEGTASALVKGVGGEWIETPATDPLGRPVGARFAVLASGIAVVETAEASGLWRVSEDERDALRADTRGTGALIAAAARHSDTVLLAAGGSATTDGGAGAIEAIVAAGGLEETALVCLCDVETSWEDAAQVFGPQKGASAREVFLLGERLDELAGRLPRDPRGVPRTGAAGGLAGGLWAALEARLESGAAYLFDALEVNARIARADLVIGGEGRLDETTLAGKALAELARRCRAASKPLHAVVGEDRSDLQLRERLNLASVRKAHNACELERAGRELAST